MYKKLELPYKIIKQFICTLYNATGARCYIKIAIPECRVAYLPSNILEKVSIVMKEKRIPNYNTYCVFCYSKDTFKDRMLHDDIFII